MLITKLTGNINSPKRRHNVRTRSVAAAEGLPQALVDQFSVLVATVTD